MIEWAFAICIFVDPKMDPYLIRPIGQVVAPSRPVCEASRQGERDWVTASGENYLVGPCQPLVGSPEDVARQKQELSCPFPRD
jgi:hypothetical protein